MTLMRTFEASGYRTKGMSSMHTYCVRRGEQVTPQLFKKKFTPKLCVLLRLILNDELVANAERSILRTSTNLA